MVLHEFKEGSLLLDDVGMEQDWTGVSERVTTSVAGGSLWLTTGLIFAVLSKVLRSSTVKLETPIDLGRVSASL